jgi:L-ectoine synthase
MIVRRLQETVGSEREVDTANWVSRRLLLKDDGMGFSLHDTTIRAGTSTRMQYANHVEAVYCVGGRGRIEDLETGVVHEIRDGTLYALDGHEAHVLTADEDLRMVCVFNPPVTGREVHDENGAYPLVADAAE